MDSYLSQEDGECDYPPSMTASPSISECYSVSVNQDCFLCHPETTTKSLSSSSLRHHIRDYHRIPCLDIFSQIFNQRSKQIHWRCQRFACERCHFKTHLESIMDKHFEKRHEGTKTQFSVETMSPVISIIQDDKDRCAGELVLAKIKGYPWWPGIIREKTYIHNNSYMVLFFDSTKTTTAVVNGKLIKDYSQDQYAKLSLSRKKQLPVHHCNRLKAAKSWADFCSQWSNQERLEYYTSKKAIKAKKQKQKGGEKVNVMMMVSCVSDDHAEQKEEEDDLDVPTAVEIEELVNDFY